MGEPTGDAGPGDDVTWGMGDAVIGLVAAMMLSFVGFAVASGITGDEQLDDIPLWGTALLQVPLWTGLLGVTVLASVRKGTGRLQDDFRLRMRPRDVPTGLLAGLVGQVAISIVVVNLYELVGIDTERVGETAEELADRASGALDAVILIAIVVVAAPIVEELFYRGLWLGAIERRAGSQVVAVVASSLIFGVMHFQPYDLLALTMAGLLFARLAVRYDRLGPAIWAHVAFNLTAAVSLLSV